MKSSLRNLFDSIFDSSLASSDITKMLIGNIKTMAIETKKIAETLMSLSERLDFHEKLILEIYEREEKAVFDYTSKRKERTSKPN